MARKTVCIVGAGPSGLVAAKNLVTDRRARDICDVTIFEAQPRIGGLWPRSVDDSDGLVHPLMLANQSRHTVQFSDLSWRTESSDDSDGVSGFSPEEAPEFPRAWQVGQYLERYYKRYCSGKVNVRLSTRVSRAEPVNDGHGGWHVWVQPAVGDSRDSTTKEEDVGHFDYLIVASGYFGGPVIPEGLLPRPADDNKVPVVHSSQYRDLETLFKGADVSSAKPGGKIVVAGGQFSGIEIAATLANHLSSAVHSPGPSLLPKADKYSIHHIVQKPAWIFPTFTSPVPTIDAPPFLPFDLVSYNLLKRPKPLVNTQGHISVEVARKVHTVFKTALGSDQSEYSADVAVQTDEDLDEPPYIGVSDTYLEHVRSGLITVSKGRISSLEGTTAKVSPVSSSTLSGSPEPISDVAAVILATGFTPAVSLSFLPQSVKEKLSFDASDIRQSVSLAFHGTHHPKVPHLAFVGYYRSQYWGIMEMQARLATALFVSDATATNDPTTKPGEPPIPWYPSNMPLWPHLNQALSEDDTIERSLALRSDPRASQFTMGDYIYLMDAFAHALDVQRFPVAGEEPILSTPNISMDIITPAHYPDALVGALIEGAGVSAAQAAESKISTDHTEKVALAGLKNSRFVARAIFRSLQGTWRLERDLISALPTHPSGRFEGTAEFRLRAATEDGWGNKSKALADPNDLEYLYVEDGTFTAAGGLSFRATRRYVWRYRAANDQLSVWFVRTDDNLRADYLFHNLEFSAGKPGAANEASKKIQRWNSPRPGGWRATAGHMCVEDFYDVAYDFAFSGVNLTDWRLRYTVQGPKKDYTIDGTYRRLLTK